jgi:putative molybdopterin biosynthesis protein
MNQLRSLDRLDAIRALTEPHRLAILRLLLARPHTISSLGRQLDKHPAWVRHHVKALEDVGLVNLAATTTTRNYTEKWYKATAAAFSVSMAVRPDTGDPSSLLALVSHDLAVELLAGEPTAPQQLRAAVTGSLDALIGVRQGLADIAGCHLLDAETGQYNTPYARHIFPDRDMVLVTLAHREQGLIVAPGNPLALKSVADIASMGARFVNRNRGSGTRVWIDQALHVAGLQGASVTGYAHEVETHTAAADAVASRRADVAVGIEAAAKRLELGFVPLFRERYDLVMSAEVYGAVETERLLDRLHTREFKRTVSHISGYDSTATGDEYRLAV